MPEQSRQQPDQQPGVSSNTRFIPHPGDKSVETVDNTGEMSSQSVSDNSDGVATRPSGRDLAHEALAAARAKAGARGTEPGVRKQRTQNPRRRSWAGPGADQRDPQPLGRIAARLADERGWKPRLANGVVFGRWTELVGEEVAEHAEPVALRDGELTVRASSTAWATQLRLLQSKLLTKIAAGVGHGVVKRMRIQGPTAPNWRKGALHVPGRGPRDTYG